MSESPSTAQAAVKTEFTPEELAAIPDYIQKWIRIGLDTDEADWDLSTSAIAKCYEYAGYNPDIPYIRVQSPIVMALAAPLSSAIINTYGEPFVGTPAVLSAAMRANITTIVSETVRNVLVAKHSSEEAEQILVGIIAAVIETVSAVKRISLQEIDLASVSYTDIVAHIKENWTLFFGGKFWVGWTAYVDYMLNVCHIIVTAEVKAKFQAYADASKSTGWWYPDNNFIMACNTPSEINISENRLHSREGRAISWRDGWSLSFINGTQIPNGWIDNPPTAAEVLATTNMELRRAGTDLIGWDAILKELNPVVLDENPDPEIGTLYEADVPNSGLERFLKVLCGTGRTFVIHVDRSCETAVEAQAWAYPASEQAGELFVAPEIRL